MSVENCPLCGDPHEAREVHVCSGLPLDPGTPMRSEQALIYLHYLVIEYLKTLILGFQERATTDSEGDVGRADARLCVVVAAEFVKALRFASMAAENGAARVVVPGAGLPRREKAGG